MIHRERYFKAKKPRIESVAFIFISKRNYPKTSFTFLPISAGESTTWIPHSLIMRFLLLLFCPQHLQLHLRFPFFVLFELFFRRLIRLLVFFLRFFLFNVLDFV